MTATTETKTARSVTDALALHESWGLLASFLIDNRDVAEQAGSTAGGKMLVYVGAYGMSTRPPIEAMVDYARRAKAAGARVEEYADANYGGVKLYFGSVYLDVYAERSKVCVQVVVGSRPDVQYRLAVALDEVSVSAQQDGGEH